MTFNTSSPNALAQLCLIACDMAYTLFGGAGKEVLLGYGKTSGSEPPFLLFGKSQSAGSNAYNNPRYA